MSEYLSKKAVLEWLESEMSINKGYPDDIDIHWTLNRVSKKILSGAFDADTSEIQRLRVALEQAKRNLLANAPKTALGHIEEALSTTTVQAERLKPFQQRLVELKHKYSSRNRGDGGMNWCEKHDHFKRTCPWCEIEILQERLNRIAAIVNVLEQHGDIDHTTLTQLRGALNWEPGKDGVTE